MNVQQTIIKGIKEQLFFNDYLVLPGFGGFVLQLHASRFSGSGLMLPPSKTVSFNVQLKQNDGILTLWLQENLACSAAESINHLKEFAEFCNSVLSTRRRLTLDGIGFFYLDFENNLCFEQQPDNNFLTSSFGLSSVTAKAIEVETPVDIREAIFEDRKVVIPGKQQTKRARLNFRRTLAPAAIIMLLAGMLVLIVSNTRMTGQLRASVFGTYAGGSYQPVTYGDLALVSVENNNTAYVTDANGFAVMTFNGNSIVVKAKEFNMSPETKTNTSGIRTSVTKGYEIVLGCFGVLDNAKRMASKLSEQHINADISAKNEKGLYTVSNGSFGSKAEALSKLEEIHRNFPKAWIKNP